MSTSKRQKTQLIMGTKTRDDPGLIDIRKQDPLRRPGYSSSADKSVKVPVRYQINIIRYLCSRTGYTQKPSFETGRPWGWVDRGKEKAQGRFFARQIASRGFCFRCRVEKIRYRLSRTFGKN
jgi:hypothetical protein